MKTIKELSKENGLLKKEIKRLEKEKNDLLYIRKQIVSSKAFYWKEKIERIFRNGK